MKQEETRQLGAGGLAPAQVVLDDESNPGHPQRVSLSLWVDPPSCLSGRDQDAAVRKAAIALLERALAWLQGGSSNDPQSGRA